MGADFYAGVMIGCKIDPNALEIALPKLAEKRRGCKHELDERYKFCPECGKPMWKTDEDVCFDDVARKLGLDVLTTTDEAYFFVTEKSAPGAVPYMREQVDLNYGTPFLSLPIMTVEEVTKLKATLKEKLEPVGLWKESNFAIWMVGRCSY